MCIILLILLAGCLLAFIMTRRRSKPVLIPTNLHMQICDHMEYFGTCLYRGSIFTVTTEGVKYIWSSGLFYEKEKALKFTKTVLEELKKQYKIE